MSSSSAPPAGRAIRGTGRILPAQGSYSSALAEVTIPGSELGYYRTRLSHQQFFPSRSGGSSWRRRRSATGTATATPIRCR